MRPVFVQAPPLSPGAISVLGYISTTLGGTAMTETRTRTTLGELLEHHDWAMERVFREAETLPPAKLDERFDPVPTTLRRVLHHLAESEALWLRRWRGEPAPGLTEPDPDLSLTDLVAGWHTTAAERRAFLDDLGEAGERRTIPYRNLRGDSFLHPLGDLMLHLANHGTHHRAQAATLLRRAGGEPPATAPLAMRRELPSTEEGAGEGTTVVRPAAFDPDTILEYYRYADWAEGLFHAEAAKLDDASLDREFPIGLKRLRRTLLHIHDAEAWWVGTWREEDMTGFAGLPPDISMSELMDRSRALSARRNEFFSACRPADLQRVLTIETSAGGTAHWRVGETALEICWHGTHHRGQLVWKLRLLGAEPPGLDYVTWLRAGSP